MRELLTGSIFVKGNFSPSWRASMMFGSPNKTQPHYLLLVKSTVRNFLVAGFAHQARRRTWDMLVYRPAKFQFLLHGFKSSDCY
jgi:hypothetical protein